MGRTLDNKPWKHARQRRWYLKNRELSCARTRKWYNENKEHADNLKREWVERNKEHLAQYNRQRSLRRKYGITPEVYDQMLEKQGGVCAICGNPPKKRRLHVDHCHETGKIRGLLCVTCNIKLGHLEGFKRLRLEVKLFEAYLQNHQDH